MKNGIQFGAGFVIGMLLIYMVLGLFFWLFWGRTQAKTTTEE